MKYMNYYNEISQNVDPYHFCNEIFTSMGDYCTWLAHFVLNFSFTCNYGYFFNNNPFHDKINIKKTLDTKKWIMSKSGSCYLHLVVNMIW